MVILHFLSFPFSVQSSSSSCTLLLSTNLQNKNIQHAGKESHGRIKINPFELLLGLHRERNKNTHCTVLRQHLSQVEKEARK